MVFRFVCSTVYACYTPITLTSTLTLTNKFVYIVDYQVIVYIVPPKHVVYTHPLYMKEREHKLMCSLSSISDYQRSLTDAGLLLPATGILILTRPPPAGIEINGIVKSSP